MIVVVLLCTFMKLSNAALGAATPPQITCGLNEIETNYGYDCITCQNRLYVTCPLSTERKCRCQDGYIRFDNGRCLSMKECRLDDECRAKGPYFKYYPFGVPCNTCIPPHICWFCNSSPGCACQEGYEFDPVSNKCVVSRPCPVLVAES